MVRYLYITVLCVGAMVHIHNICYLLHRKLPFSLNMTYCHMLFDSLIFFLICFTIKVAGQMNKKQLGKTKTNTIPSHCSSMPMIIVLHVLTYMYIYMKLTLTQNLCMPDIKYMNGIFRWWWHWATWIARSALHYHNLRCWWHKLTSPWSMF